MSNGRRVCAVNCNGYMSSQYSFVVCSIHVFLRVVSKSVGSRYSLAMYTLMIGSPPVNILVGFDCFKVFPGY